MFHRRTPTIIVSTLLVGLGSTVLASPAHAATDVTLSGALVYDANAFGPGLAGYTGGVFSRTSVTGPAVSLIVTATGLASGPPGQVAVQAPGFLSLGGTDCAVLSCLVDDTGTPVTFTIDASASNAAVVLEMVGVGVDVQGGGGTATVFTVTYAAGPAPGPTPTPSPPESSALNEGLGSHIQQFAMPAVGTCGSAQPEGLNWSGVADGGWGESWAQWQNEGEGGAVCTRTLVYDISDGLWEVQ